MSQAFDFFHPALDMARVLSGELDLQARLDSTMRSALIAIIDDDGAARDAMVSLVAAMGFDARGFEGAFAFLSSDMRVSTACLISDVRMPGMSGLELYRNLLASGHDIPTILTTAYPDDTTRARALDAGVHGYLAKPFDPDVLLACLHAALRTG